MPGQLAGLSGYALLAVICGLLFIEELGVPILFAPGDLLLVLAGIAIAAGQVSPIVGIAATTLSVLAGALLGRELFARLGWGPARRIAGARRIGGAVEALGERLRRGGSRAVLLGRLTPGLRVHTTEAVGLAGLPRRTFTLGLVPAVLVYEMVFVGLGIGVGPAAWTVVQEYAPRPDLLLVLVLLGVALTFAARRIGRGNVSG